MASLRSRTAARLTAHPAAFWAGVALLNALLLLPLILSHLSSASFFPELSLDTPRGWYGALLELVRRPGQDLFRLNVDLALILFALALAAPTRHRAWVRRAGLGLFLFLLLYEIYDAAVATVFHRPGIFYDDAGYVMNALYLAYDLLTPSRALLALAGLALVYALFRGLAGLFGMMAHHLRRGRLRAVALIAGPALLAGFGLLAVVYSPGSPATALRSTLARVALNGQQSVTMYRAVDRMRALPLDTLYAGYDRIRLQERPSIYFFMIESYGSALNEADDFRDPYRRLMQRLGDTLAAEGWAAVTNHSRAPVYGGRSWLSIGSVLGGVALTNNIEHTLFLERLDQYPHLVRFLDALGYETFVLQPPNRRRPGLPLVNLYAFDRTIFADDLHYTGAPTGLWGIPDQHSLNYAHEAYLDPGPRPHFLFFETISTHAPWENLPRYAADWRSLNQTRPEPVAEQAGFWQALLASYRNRRLLERPRIREQYFASIAYDLQVVRDFILERADPDGIVVVLGDHQPPIVGTEHMETPVHVFTRDSLFLEPFLEAGFVHGTIDPSTLEGGIRHEGLYSLFVHALTARYGDAAGPIPPVRTEGVPKSVLVPHRGSPAP